MEHSYLIYRNESFGVSQAIVVKAKTTEDIKNDEQLYSEIRKVVTNLVKKGILKHLYEYAGSDMNIGDLASYHAEDDICNNSNFITYLKFESIEIPEFWHYDSSLCEDLEDE